MTTFNKDLFLKANKDLKDNSQFTEVDDGFYICTLDSASINNSKGSGRLQASFYWKVDDEDVHFAGKTIGQHIGLTQDGVDSEQGYKILCIVLGQLGIKDPVQQLMDGVSPEDLIESVVTSKVRLHKKENDKGYTDLRIKKLVESPLVEGSVTNSAGREVLQSWQMPTSEFRQGVQCIVKKADGDYLAKIMAYAKGANTVKVLYDHQGLGSEVVSTDIIAKASKPLVDNAIKQATDEPVEEVVEATEEVVEDTVDENVTLEIGMNVKGTFNGNQVTGTVHGFSDDGTKVKIKVGNKAYPCLLDTIELVA